MGHTDDGGVVKAATHAWRRPKYHSSLTDHRPWEEAMEPYALTFVAVLLVGMCMVGSRCICRGRRKVEPV
ncbi:MAG: hypothetical protein JWQ22_1130 [Devosia sp.]|nr:hypothetical protein [Devosia sp.]